MLRGGTAPGEPGLDAGIDAMLDNVDIPTNVALSDLQKIVAEDAEAG